MGARMGCSATTMLLAMASIVYTTACVLYLLFTIPLGTPFRDSLTPRQREIKRESARARSLVFSVSLLIAGATLVLARPFRPCQI